ncbi:MAG: periplasmic heavy metal sensor [Terriglobia bacterium]|jgi:Spy/CpxP family protein refolding chaperone
MKSTAASLALAIVFCGLAVAQEMPPPPEGGPGGPDVVHGRGPNGPLAIIRVDRPGKWWKDSDLMKKLGVSDDQVAKIEKIFQDHRLQLIDLHADLEKQEAILEPLVEADQPVESQVAAQIDKVAQARANLEKSDALMLLAIRRVLTVDQWKKLRDVPGVNMIGNTFHPRA